MAWHDGGRSYGYDARERFVSPGLVERAAAYAAQSGAAVDVDEHEARDGSFRAALVCWRCSESVDLDAPAAVLAAFAAEHKGCDDDGDPVGW